MPIKCGRGNHTHETMLDVRACYNGEDVESAVATGPTDTVVADELDATDKQIGFLCTLADQKLPPAEASVMKKDATEGRWGRRSISPEINRLRSLPKRPAEKATESDEETQTPGDLEVGMYRMDETIYKVQVAVHGSRHPYAKRLFRTDYCGVCGEHENFHDDGPHEFKVKWAFEYARGMVQKLRPEHKMSLEEAKEFGALYGTCCCCGATLTREESIENGIGPICGGKYF
jgi:Family of unknown function (DUF6011)